MAGRLEAWLDIAVNQTAFSVAVTPNGQYIAVGHEQGAEIFTASGQRIFAYPDEGYFVPVRQVAISADLGQMYLLTRQGLLLRFNLQRQMGNELRFQAQKLYEMENDLWSMAISEDWKRIVVGHLSSGLSSLETDGSLLWQLHDSLGSGLDGKTWSVAMDDMESRLYVGCLGSMTNYITVLDAKTGIQSEMPIYLDFDECVTSMATLSGNQGLLVSINRSNAGCGRLVCYNPRLEICWEKQFDEGVTAICTDLTQPRASVVVGVDGLLYLFDTREGKLLAQEPMRSIVNGIAMAQGRIIAAAMQEGVVRLIRYLS